MLRKIISEQTKRHICDCETLGVKRVNNYFNDEAVIYCSGVFRIPLYDEAFIKDVEKLLQHIVCNLDDSIKNMYKED